MSLRPWLPLALTPIAALSTVGMASNGGTADAVQKLGAATTAAPALVLPQGVRRRPDGRYVEQTCARCKSYFLLPEDWSPGDAVPPRPSAAATAHALTPQDLLTAYSIPPASSAGGKIVAIIDTPNSNAYSDLSAYRNRYTIPSLPRCAGLPNGTAPCFAQVAEDGGASTGTDPEPEADVETSFGMDMISAVCPDCSILLVEISPNLCETDSLAAVDTATRLGAVAISLSYGGPELTDPNMPPSSDDGGSDDGGICTSEANWKTDAPGPFSSPGHLVFAAAGDFAYDNGNLPIASNAAGSSPTWPSSSPYVISVGGTALYLNGTTYSEGVWDNHTFGTHGPFQDVTTSGCSTEFDLPPWQVGVVNGTSCSRRVTADISAAATFFDGALNEGIDLIVDGTESTYEGTSAASPIAAAIFTRLGLTSEASNDLGWLYTSASSAFNDVGSDTYPIADGGSNTNAPTGSTCGKLCCVFRPS